MSVLLALQSGGGTTLIDVSDVGSGAETVSILALVSISDAGSGVESTPGILALIPTSDIGSGTEFAPAITAIVGTSDNGAGLEGFDVTGDVPVADVGSGVEAETILAILSTSDVGSGNESQDILAIVGTSDNGVGLEGLDVTGDTPISDSGSGAETEEILATIPVSDIGSGAELEDVLATIQTEDVGSATESEDILATVGTSDNAVGLEDFNVTGDVPVGDFGEGVEQAIQINEFSTIFEYGVGEESLDLFIQISVSDHGYGHDDYSDSSGVVALVSVADQGSVLEAVLTVEIKPPNPAPTYGGGSGGGGGGAPTPPGTRRVYLGQYYQPVGSGSSWIVKDLAQKASLGLLTPKKTDAPAVIPQEITREEIQRGMIRGLRDRITRLEARIRELKVAGQFKADQAIRSELDVALRTVSELRDLVATLATKLDLALKVPTPVPALRRPVTPSTPSATPLWAAGGLFLLAECLPDRGSRAKDALRSTAGAIALAWGLKWIDSL